MAYIPTKEELEEFGFNDVKGGFIFGGSSNGYVAYNTKLGIFSTTPLDLYPKSLDDIKTLIRLLTPQ